tara:strand:- start:1165 stop:1548 length:384 start_codon:yes stop_codon:yes gene_type:complete
MLENNLTLAQSIYNRANSRENFTSPLNSAFHKGRYVVGCTEVFVGKNPSICPAWRMKLTEVLEERMGTGTFYSFYDSIGGWKDEKTGVYYVSANLHFHGREIALRQAKANGQIAIYDQEEGKVIYLS